MNAEFLYHFSPQFITNRNASLPVIFAQNSVKIDQALWGYPTSKNFQDPVYWVRSEGVLRKAISRYAVRRQRCLIPANGFYIKKDHRIFLQYFPYEPVFAMAGMYWIKKVPDSKEILYFSILTSPSVHFSGIFTSRMPVILGSSAGRKYLNPSTPMMDITRIIKHISIREASLLEVDPHILKHPALKRKEFLNHVRKIKPAGNFKSNAIFNNFYFHFAR